MLDLGVPQDLANKMVPTGEDPSKGEKGNTGGQGKGAAKGQTRGRRGEEGKATREWGVSTLRAWRVPRRPAAPRLARARGEGQ